jgi:hypothetical protein
MELGRTLSQAHLAPLALPHRRGTLYYDNIIITSCAASIESIEMNCTWYTKHEQEYLGITMPYAHDTPAQLSCQGYFPPCCDGALAL